jgi:hypothetical protein
MLQTYHAEITGTQLQWLDTPPASVNRQRVLIVFDTAFEAETSAKHVNSVLPASSVSAFKAARGSLTGLTRESVLADIAASRKDWD